MSDRSNINVVTEESSQKPEVVYLYDESFDGALTCVFNAYENRENLCEILPSASFQPSFTKTYIHVETDAQKAKRVYEAIGKKVSHDALFHIYRCFLSNDINKATYIYKYIKKALIYGAKTIEILTDDDILKLQKISGYVGMENHKLCGFVRFSHLCGNIYYSKIAPTNNVTPLLANYFTDRMGSERWIIHDDSRGIAAIYDGNRWVLTSMEDITLPPISENEEKYQELWKSFYNSIAIKERFNYKCMRNLMPKKYWSNLLETTPAFVKRGKNSLSVTVPRKKHILF